jgi:hypothetical protein
MLGSTAVLPDVGPGEATRLGVYVLDGDVAFAPLIKFAVNTNAVGVLVLNTQAIRSARSINGDAVRVGERAVDNIRLTDAMGAVAR